jgi:hypothetical protein
VRSGSRACGWSRASPGSPRTASSASCWPAETRDPGTAVLARLKLDPKASGGIGQEAFKAVHPLGSGSFTKVKTGQVDQFDLKPDQAGRIYLRGQLKAGAAIVIVVVPDDEEVAATSFEAGGEPQGNRPRLVLEFVVSQ